MPCLLGRGRRQCPSQGIQHSPLAMRGLNTEQAFRQGEETSWYHLPRQTILSQIVNDNWSEALCHEHNTRIGESNLWLQERTQPVRVVPGQVAKSPSPLACALQSNAKHARDCPARN